MIRSRSLLLVLALVVCVAGCFDEDPVSSKEDDSVQWPDMTERDDVIAAILLCYEHPEWSVTMARYEALLHSQYVFHLNEWDVQPGEAPFITRAEDLLSTEWIFENQTLLQLSLDPEQGGAWEELPELGGEPCVNCWVGRRAYVIRAQFGDDETIYSSSPGSHSVTIVVAPDESAPSKWVLRAIYDEYDN